MLPHYVKKIERLEEQLRTFSGAPSDRQRLQEEIYDLYDQELEARQLQSRHNHFLDAMINMLDADN